MGEALVEPLRRGEDLPLQAQSARDVFAGVGPRGDLERFDRAYPRVVESSFPQRELALGARQRNVPAPAEPNVRVEHLPGAAKLGPGGAVVAAQQADHPQLEKRVGLRLRPRPDAAGDLRTLAVAL